MPRIAYVNGRFVPLGEARVHVEDRGYQFADGVYEVIAFTGGRLLDEAAHLDRLERSLAALSIAMPRTRAAFGPLIRETVRRNRLGEGILYIQVTRGVARRDHGFPKDARPSLVMTVRRLKRPTPTMLDEGVAVITIPDERWKRCDIKSISLLPNVLGKQAARQAGAFEAWMVDEKGMITEGTSSNAWIVTADGVLKTRAADSAILGGVTRRNVLDLAASLGIGMEEGAFTVKEARAAREAFLTSTTNFVLPVTRIDGSPLGDGRPGPLTRALHQAASGMLAPLPGGGR